MYTIKPARAYRKSLKRLAGSGTFDVTLVDSVVNTLAEGAMLEAHYKNHPLDGEYTGCFECHIKGDLLLIYERDETLHIITLVDIGSHSELFG